MDQYPNALDSFDIRVSDIPLERGRNSNDRSAIIGLVFYTKVLSRARRLYEPHVLVASLLEGPRLVGTIVRLITDDGMVIITRKVKSSTSLTISEAVSVLIRNGNPFSKCPNLTGAGPTFPKLNFRVVCWNSAIQVQAIIRTMGQYPNATDTFDIRVFDIPLERVRNSNDRSAIMGVAFDPEVLSRAGRLYVPHILVAILLEDPRLVVAIVGVETDDGVVVITREVKGSTSLTVFQAVC